MYIALYDLGLFIAFISILIVSSYLIAVLHRIYGVLGQVRGVIDTHKDDIGKIISGIPGALENVNEMTVSLKRSADLTTIAFDTLQNNVIDTVDDMRDGLENFALYAKVVVEVFRTVFSKSG